MKRQPIEGMRMNRFEIVEESRMPPTLDAAIRKFLCLCFPSDAATFTKTRHWHGSAPTYSVIHAISESIWGHVGVVIRTIRWGSREVAVAGVQNLAVHPQMRGSGLGAKITVEAMAEARRRGLGFGLLFCARSLRRYYEGHGWFTVDVAVTMSYENGNQVRMPEKNICMVIPLSGDVLLQGDIDLQGPDW